MGVFASRAGAAGGGGFMRGGKPIHGGARCGQSGRRLCMEGGRFSVCKEQGSPMRDSRWGLYTRGRWALVMRSAARACSCGAKGRRGARARA